MKEPTYHFLFQYFGYFYCIDFKARKYTFLSSFIRLFAKIVKKSKRITKSLSQKTIKSKNIQYKNNNNNNNNNNNSKNNNDNSNNDNNRGQKIRSIDGVIVVLYGVTVVM